MPRGYRYPGTRPFSAEDESVFYGRKQDIDRLYQLLSLKNMLIFYSASGMGKSSLIRAGLIPRLRNEIKEKTFLPVTIRFGASDNDGNNAAQTLLNIAIAELVKEANKLQDKKLPFIDDSETFSSLWCLVKLFEKNNIHLLIIVDQAEEIFTYKTDEVNRFKEELYLLFSRNIPAFLHNQIQEQLDLLESEDNNVSPGASNQQDNDKLDSINSDVEFIYSPLKVKILFAIREDKLGLFNVFSDYFPDVLKDTYKLLPLSKANASEAITGPAKTPGDFVSPCFDFSERALENLLTNIKEDNDTYDPFSIQLNCSYIEMNCVINQKKKTIEEADVPDEGKIVRDYYQSVWNSVPGTDAEKENYKREIEEKLIDAKQEIRKYVYEKDLSNISGILHLLQQKGLVRQDQRGEDHYIELSHDRLIKPMIEASRQRIAEENLKKEYEQRLRKAGEEKAEAEARRKKVKTRIYTGIAITVAVIFVVSCVVIWLEARKDRELEIYQSYLTVNKANPTLAYNIAMYGQAKGFSSFADLVAKTDTVSSGYITTAFIVPDNTHGTYLSHDKTQIIVVGETEIRYFNKRGVLDSVKPFNSNIIYSSYNDGKGYLLLQNDLMGRFELTSFDGSTLVKFSDYEMPKSFQVSSDGDYLMINNDTFKIQDRKAIALRPGNSTANPEITASCFTHSGNSIIKGYWNGYVVNGNDSFRNSYSGVASLRAVNDSIVLAIGQDNNINFINIKNKQTDRDNISAGNSSASIGKIRGETFGAITSIGLSGDKVVIATEDQQARIYFLDGKRMATLTGHTGKIVNANFSDDGKEVVTASTNGEVFVWKVGKSDSLKGEIRKLSPLDYQILLKNVNPDSDKNNVKQKLDNLIGDNVTYIRQFYSGSDEENDSAINATLEADYKAIMQPSLSNQLSIDEKRLLLSNYSKISSIQLERADPKNVDTYNALLDKRDSLGISIILIDTVNLQKALEFSDLFNFYINSMVKANDYNLAVKYNYKKIDLLRAFYLKDRSNTQIKNELVNSLGSVSFYSCYVGRYDDAVRNSLKAIKIDSNRYWLYTNLALGYLLSGRYTEAIDIYTKYKDKPTDLATHDLRKVKAGFLGDLDEFEKKGIISKQNTKLYQQVQYIRNNILK